MDITCSRCGEPWDADTIHEEIAERHPGKPWEAKIDALVEAGTPRYKAYDDVYGPLYQEVRKELREKGCGVAFRTFMGGGGKPCERVQSNRTEIAGLLDDILGDDIDGIASMMEDAEAMGLL